MGKKNETSGFGVSRMATQGPTIDLTLSKLLKILTEMRIYGLAFGFCGFTRSCTRHGE